MNKRIIAAILNFIIWGSGYFYLGKRKLFGVGLLFSEILLYLPLLYFKFEFYMQSPMFLYLASHILISISLAFDAYKGG